MQASAFSTAVASGLLFALVALCLSLLARRFKAGLFVRGTLCVALVAVAIFATPPLVLLARSGFFEVTEPGHAFANFMFPYLGICLVSVVAALLLSKSKRKES